MSGIARLRDPSAEDAQDLEMGKLERNCVVLVDDLVSTGKTLLSVARLLTQQNAQMVAVVCIIDLFENHTNSVETPIISLLQMPGV